MNLTEDRPTPLLAGGDAHPPPTAPKVRGEGALLATLVILAAATFATSAAVQTAGYAVWHDELWNHPAAVSLIQGKSWRPAWEVSVLGLPLPLVSGPYQGSIKTLALVPFLATLGSAPGVLRGIHCLFGLLYLAALYWALRAVLSRRAAAWVFLLPLAIPTSPCSSPATWGLSCCKILSWPWPWAPSCGWRCSPGCAGSCWRLALPVRPWPTS